jgi:predicted phage terminase large subunit-like protein
MAQPRKFQIEGEPVLTAEELAALTPEQWKARRQAYKKVMNVRRAARRRVAISKREELKAKRQKAAHNIANKRHREKLAARRGEIEITTTERELMWREAARRRLLPFVLRFHRKYRAGWVHRDICARLEKFSDDVANGTSPRLMLFMPPRTGKSELASVNFPAWHLGRHPDHEIIACSYAQSLAIKFSRKARALCRDPGYLAVFPAAALDDETQAAEEWLTKGGGGYVAVGIGGPITGKGAHVLSIDDPVKNREDADSASAREMVKDWYSSTAYTRLSPGGGVLVTMTRWSEDDLAGWLLALQDAGEGDKWEVVIYPAIAEVDEPYRARGEALHPERYDLEALMRIKRTLIPRDWHALYQQKPVVETGLYFKKDMFRYYDQLPAGKRYKFYAAWDLAIGRKESNDYTVGIVVAVDEDDVIYVVDMIRGKWTSFEIVEQMINAHERWGTELVGIEQGQLSLAIEPILEKRMKERKVFLPLAPLKPGRRDKESRARAIQGRMQQGAVMFPRGAGFIQDLVNELMKFTAGGVHDDVVDAIAWIGQMLQEMTGPQRTKEVQKKSWRNKIKGFMKKDSLGAMAA